MATFYGTDINDAEVGGAHEQFYGGAGNDLLTSDFAAGTFMSGGTGDDRVAGFSGPDRISGDDGNDQLTGGAGNDYLAGGDGNDFLDGGVGVDRMLGGDGNDRYQVDNAGDVVIEAVDSGFDGVQAAVSYVLRRGSAVEVLETNDSRGTAAINLTGSDNKNAILGNAGANVLNGGFGNDTLVGSRGTDTFVFDTPLDRLENVDRILDFARLADTIRLDHAIFTRLPVGPLDPEAFRLNASSNFAKEADDRIIYNRENGYLLYDADGTGHAVNPIKFAVLDNKVYINAADFVVV